MEPNISICRITFVNTQVTVQIRCERDTLLLVQWKAQYSVFISVDKNFNSNEIEFVSFIQSNFELNVLFEYALHTLNVMNYKELLLCFNLYYV